MNTVGQILKTARLNKKISLSKLSDMTKIKREFIEEIENNNWQNLPDYPVVSGFIKNIAISLGLSSNNINAVLRRDYPPKKLRINPKPDVGEKFTWSPKLTFAVSVAALMLIVLGYLGFEYSKYLKPPQLIIISPKENEVIFQTKVTVQGKTTTDAILTINNQPIILDQDGNFISEIDVTKETTQLKFVSVSRSGKITEKTVKITIE